MQKLSDILVFRIKRSQPATDESYLNFCYKLAILLQDMEKWFLEISFDYLSSVSSRIVDHKWYLTLQPTVLSNCLRSNLETTKIKVAYDMLVAYCLSSSATNKTNAANSATTTNKRQRNCRWNGLRLEETTEIRRASTSNFIVLPSRCLHFEQSSNFWKIKILVYKQSF